MSAGTESNSQTPSVNFILPKTVISVSIHLFHGTMLRIERDNSDLFKEMIALTMRKQTQNLNPHSCCNCV